MPPALSLYCPGCVEHNCNSVLRRYGTGGSLNHRFIDRLERYRRLDVVTTARSTAVQCMDFVASAGDVLGGNCRAGVRIDTAGGS